MSHEVHTRTHRTQCNVLKMRVIVLSSMQPDTQTDRNELHRILNWFTFVRAVCTLYVY